MSPAGTPGRPSKSDASAGGRPNKPAGSADRRSGTAPSRRMSREAALALVLLPVLLVAGFLLGGQLLNPGGGSSQTAAQSTRAPAATAPATSAAAGPSAGPAAPTASAVLPGATAPATAAAPSAGPGGPAAAPPAPAPSNPPAAGGKPGATAIPVPLAGPKAVFGIGSASADVRTWQARMAERGWKITVDGIYGPQTASVARAFQIEKGLHVDGLVGPQTWAAAWTAPITP